ncbi:MAG: LapA family protein [Rectinema sp.]|nr:LapA family protein [Rectinema sp.]
MKIAYIVILLIVAVLAVIFAVQNSAAVTVTLFGWMADAPLSLVLVIAFGIGILIGMFLLLPSLWKRSWALSRERRETQKLRRRPQDTESEAVTPAQEESARKKPEGGET